MKKTKIILRLEKDGKYIEKQLTERMMCALFDLQYMMGEDTWETVELNKMDEDLSNFFKIVEHIDDAMHGEQLGMFNNKGHVEWKPKEDNDYMFGKPKWRKIKNDNR